MAHRYLYYYLCLMAAFTAGTQGMSAVETASDTVAKRPGLVRRVIDYFDRANEEKPGGGLDFSIIGGPYYSSEMGFGIGVVASGIYGHGVANPDCPPSNVSLFGKVSTKGFGSLGIRGTHISADESLRVNYLAEVVADPSDYWGIGYEMANNDANKSRIKRNGVNAEVTALAHLGHHLYFGPMATYNFVRSHDIQRPELLEGMRGTTWAGGAGVTLTYDSRDVLTNPHKGVYVAVTQCFYPKFIGNRYPFSSTRIQADWYKSVWKDGIVAADVRSEFNTGHPSWHMMASVGGSYYLRGYYEGRYRDKNMMAAQVELRQRVYRRSGIALWAGVASVFSHFSEVQMRRALPNLGLGYRWEFKKDVNVRIDVGFGKHGQSGFMFNINEAF